MGSHSRAPSGIQCVLCTRINHAGLIIVSPAMVANSNLGCHRRRQTSTNSRYANAGNAR
ncbi:Uncharacterised protein [Mycobacterium tuberculosis]|uniref:Uncharacterized protein n=1 Tax=Mycobacterium tuberculosis TaxID=1773 RepID=A0A655A4G0_MYCTX|nr:Uncharacterised protein [Mycobacterium tuberculosis]CKR78272.1 Uncharacterised protein [Mycobacterium tuberculosis]CKR81437.1 Uncharacterised protein [Mycobacterium tuberculosis]CKT49022.1 Uncharacterised protein [Mycobacterium tuberculosis]COW62840.1 Uncharacterised protein [Mycobacterium tuberculosis]